MAKKAKSAAAKLDAETLKLQAALEEIYKKAQESVQKEMNDFIAQNYIGTNPKIQELDKKLASGLITPAEHKTKVTEIVNQLTLQSQHYKDLINDLSQGYTNANKLAADYVNGNIAKAYGIGYNDVGMSVEDAVKGYSYTMVNQYMINTLAKQNKALLPKASVDIPKDLQWNKKKITAELIQGLLRGETVGQISKRLQSVTTMNYNSAMRNARTMVTSAENRGRQEGYKTAADKGVVLKKRWMAANDGRVRDSHVHLDGETIGTTMYFSNGLMFPGDPNGKPEEVYNCRCTMVTVVEGFKHAEVEVAGQDPNAVPGSSTDPNAAAVVDPNANATPPDPVQDLANQISEEEKKMMALQDQKTVLQGDIDVTANNMKPYENLTYSNIWYNDVTVKDWGAKKWSYQAKKDYFLDKLNNTTDPDEVVKFTDLLAQLEDYKVKGEEYEALAIQLKQLKSQMDAINKDIKSLSVAVIDDKFSQDRKDAALWFTTNNGGAKASYNAFVDVSSDVWMHATEDEKEAIYTYTHNYSPVNEPLRGIEYWTNKWQGVGNVDLDEIGVKTGHFNKGEVKKRIDDMTSIISKSTYNEDIWLNRGCDYGGMDKFLNVSMNLLTNGSQDDLENALLGTNPTEYAFFSCGSSKGYGFHKPITFNTYCPAGTEMMYVEPFSEFGHGDGRSWNGLTRQRSVGSENEMILNRETTFRITKVERAYPGGPIYIDLEVIDQERKVNK